MGKTVALVLAGGQGKRMDMLCYLRPKPALPFAGNLRVIDFSINNCVHSRISDIAVLVDHQHVYMSNYLKGWYSDNLGRSHLKVLPPSKGFYAGTDDAVYQNIDYLEKQNADTVLVVSGDNIYQMDYRWIIAFHQAMKANVTTGIFRVPPEEIKRFGAVGVNATGKVYEFVEKPVRPKSSLASMGIYVFNKETLLTRLREDASDHKSSHDFGYSILPRMVKIDRVFAYRHKGYWQDIGTIEAYYKANMELLENKPSFSLSGERAILGDSNVLPIHIENREGHVINSIVSPGCVINGRVENSVLSPGVHVAEQAVIRDSIIMDNVSIGYHSVVDRCIFDEGVTIGKYCYVGFGFERTPGNRGITVLGKDVTMPDCTAVGRKCKVLHQVGPAEFVVQRVADGTVLTPR